MVSLTACAQGLPKSTTPAAGSIAKTKEVSNKLGPLALIVGSMIGGGVFSLLQNTAKGASPGAVIIGWAITGLGMLDLAFVYQGFSTRKLKLDAGPYADAPFAGFCVLRNRWCLLKPSLDVVSVKCHDFHPVASSQLFFSPILACGPLCSAQRFVCSGLSVFLIN